MKICVVIPVYNHQEAIVLVVEALKPFDLPCYLVNDGSSAQCSAVLRRIAEQEKDWITLYERDRNGGKGAAVMDGLQLGISAGFSHAIQIGANGQHRLAYLSRFLTASTQHPDKLILSKPRFDAAVPKKRLYGRQLTNLWIWTTPCL